MNEPSSSFLDVPTLLDQSQPRPRGNWLWIGVGIFLLIVLGSAWLGQSGGPLAGLVSVFSAIAMLGIIVGMALVTWMTVRAARAEQKQLEAIEELIQLRRWPQAAAVLEQMLSRPTRTPVARVQGLIYLTSVLARYNRFDDAIAIHNHLLQSVNLDASTAHALRLGRAMAMLREDHLLDADRAISEMRRDLRALGAESGSESEVGESAGLALVELYRDVKTGHAAEAVEIFESRLPILRKQLGHRVGDAWALAARAYDQLSRQDDAQRAYENATALGDRLELERRYPEIVPLATKYRSTEVPAAA
jgi:tetratricopeptide (TPR) repeat protein